MPWDIDTYVGLEIYKPDDGARYGMYQLMIAINEREAAIGEPKTEWMLPDGTEKDEPFDVELIGADVRVGSTIKTNCDRIWNAIGRLVSGKPQPVGPRVRVFVVASESDTYWTMSALQVAIGHVYVASRGPQDALFLQNSKDILDRLVYVRLSLDYIGAYGSTSATRYYNAEPAVSTSWNDAWGSMASESVTLPSSSRYASPAIGPTQSSIWLGVAGGSDSGTGTFSTSIINDGSLDIDLTPYQGIVTRAVMGYVHVFGGNWNDVLDVDFGGIALTTSSASIQYVDIDSILTGPGFSDNIDFSLSSIGGTISPLGEFTGRFRVGDTIIYIDLSSILLDQ